MSGHAGHQIGLILSGGGARAAYQIGVLRAIADILPDAAPNPFPIICGTSAGSINAAALAAAAPDFKTGVARMVRVWSGFEIEQVYHADVWSAASRGSRLIFAMLTGGSGHAGPRSLLDNTPLRELLLKNVPFERIDQAVDNGDLRALSVTACSYNTGRSVSWYRGAEDLQPWTRARRLGVHTSISVDHLMASSGIPIVFPAVAVDGEYFGDGSMRQTSPISPALHLGADKVLIIGVRQESPQASANFIPPGPGVQYPGMGQIAGYILDTLFLNSLNADIERLQRINQTLELVPAAARERIALRSIETFIISPSQDIGAIAEPHMDLMPSAVQYLLRVIGARRGGGKQLLSYLLFHGTYCGELMDLGFNDTMNSKDKLREFLTA
jgi:NTE family protein